MRLRIGSGRPRKRATLSREYCGCLTGDPAIGVARRWKHGKDNTAGQSPTEGRFPAGFREGKNAPLCGKDHSVSPMNNSDFFPCSERILSLVKRRHIMFTLFKLNFV